MRRLPLLVVVIVLVVAGCAGGGPAQTPENDTSAPTAANTPTATPAATATTPTPTTASTPTATQAPTATPTDPTTRTVTVINVVDGDTVDVRWPNGTEERVRLVGVDTPEVHVPIDPPEWEGIPDTEAGHTCLRDAGDEASVFVERSLSGKTVEISFDANLDRRGYYGRLLGYLHVAGETINYRLVAAGHARVYDSDFTERERFEAAESEAQTARQHAWGCRSLADDGTDDGTDDETTTGDALAVQRVHADAVGNDYDNLNDEYVIFENTGTETLDLSGWTVADEAGHTYTVPAGTTLSPDTTLTLHTGSGTDTATDRYWGAGGPVWNNAGDTVVVTDDAGQQRLAYSY